MKKDRLEKALIKGDIIEVCRIISENLLATASDKLSIEKACAPSFFIFKDGTLGYVPANFTSIESKLFTSKVIFATCKAIDADAVFLVTESWTVSIDYKDKDLKKEEIRDSVCQYGSLSEHPESEERLTVAFMTRVGCLGILWSKIYRDKDNNPYVQDSEWMETNEGGTSSRILQPWGSLVEGESVH